MEKKMKINSTQKIQLAGASLLLLCILPLPYGFYTIVRIVTTIISAYLAYEYYTQYKKGLAITFSIVAVLFQPFIKFALGREIWLIVDILVGGFLLALVFKDKLIKKQQKERENALFSYPLSCSSSFFSYSPRISCAIS